MLLVINVVGGKDCFAETQAFWRPPTAVSMDLSIPYIILDSNVLCVVGAVGDPRCGVFHHILTISSGSARYTDNPHWTCGGDTT